MAYYFPGNVYLLTFKSYRAAANASRLMHTQVLVLVPVFLIPAFLPRQSAYAKPEPQVRRTLEVWPANHYREEAPIVSNNNSHSTTYRGGYEGDTPHGFEGDLPQHHASAQHHAPTQLHSSPQQTSPQHASGFEGDMPQHHTSSAGPTRHAISDSSTARVAGAVLVPFCPWPWPVYFDKTCQLLHGMGGMLCKLTSDIICKLVCFHMLVPNSIPINCSDAVFVTCGVALLFWLRVAQHKEGAVNQR